MTKEPHNQVYLSADGRVMAISDSEGRQWVTIHNKAMKKYIAKVMGFKPWQLSED